MSRIISAVALAAAFTARYPNTESGTVDISASAEPVPEIQASAVRGFAATAGPLQWVKATTHFFQGGELIQEGDYVQVQELDAKRLVASERAELATDEDVAAAQKKGK